MKAAALVKRNHLINEQLAYKYVEFVLSLTQEEVRLIKNYKIHCEHSPRGYRGKSSGVLRRTLRYGARAVPCPSTMVFKFKNQPVAIGTVLASYFVGSNRDSLAIPADALDTVSGRKRYFNYLAIEIEEAKDRVEKHERAELKRLKAKYEKEEKK